MLFAFDIHIPAGTPDNSPIMQTLKLTSGILTHSSVKFPEGCHGLVNVLIFNQDLQLIPLSKDEFLTGDGDSVDSEQYYEILAEQNEFTFKGSSPNCTFDHTITVRLTVLPEEVASLIKVQDLITQLLNQMGVSA